MPGSLLSSYHHSPRRIMQISVIFSAVILVIFTYLDLAGYLNVAWMKTLPAPWNDNVVYLLIIIAAIHASGLGFVLVRQFKSHEPQRNIWLFFACGWTCWVLGEISGFVLNQIYQTLPDLTINDIFWSLGYVFFGLSLFYQYLLIYVRGNLYAPIKRTRLPVFFLVAFAVLLLTVALNLLVRQTGYGQGSVWLYTFLLILYPVCDLVEGMAALWFSFLFRKGPLGRPWL